MKKDTMQLILPKPLKYITISAFQDEAWFLPDQVNVMKGLMTWSQIDDWQRFIEHALNFLRTEKLGKKDLTNKQLVVWRRTPKIVVDDALEVFADELDVVYWRTPYHTIFKELEPDSVWYTVRPCTVHTYARPHVDDIREGDVYLDKSMYSGCRHIRYHSDYSLELLITMAQVGEETIPENVKKIASKEYVRRSDIGAPVEKRILETAKKYLAQ